jgi:polyisoprenoid-binding protein YceI
MSTTKWALDPTHSELQFKVRHLMVSNVTGHFKTFTATVETEGDDISTAKVNVTVDVNSVSTNNEQRDGHLKTGDFFAAEEHPQIVFEGDKLVKVSDEEYKLPGNLTMRGVTHPVTLNVEFGGITKDPWGFTRSGFTVTGKIKRTLWGVSFGAVSDTGNIMLGDDINISANAEFVKQEVAEPVQA